MAVPGAPNRASVLFVDPEAKALADLERTLVRQRNRWAMSFAPDASGALEVLAAQPIDVVVSDLGLRTEQGIELLEHISRTHPSTIRILMTHAERAASAGGTVGTSHRLLAKPYRATDIEDAIEQAIRLRVILSSRGLRELTISMDNLPSLPSVYMEIDKVLKSRSACSDKVGEIIARDLGLSARILKLVNSPLLGLRRVVADPARAVAFLGVETVRDLVLSIQVFDALSGAHRAGLDLEEEFSHSTYVARLARQIARDSGLERPEQEQAFLAGLLHDSGQLILAAKLPEVFRRVLQRMETDQISQVAAEEAELGATHAEVGAYLIGLWGMLDRVVESVAFHHRLDDIRGLGVSVPLALYTANALLSEAHQAFTENPDPRLLRGGRKKFASWCSLAAELRGAPDA